jgi:hypothetical protein
VVHTRSGAESEQETPQSHSRSSGSFPWGRQRPRLPSQTSPANGGRSESRGGRRSACPRCCRRRGRLFEVPTGWGLGMRRLALLAMLTGIPRSHVEAVLFWLGGCAFFGFAPLFAAYVLNDFTPNLKTPTPARAAWAGIVLGGLLLLPSLVAFAWGQSRHSTNTQLERRRAAPLIAMVTGSLMTGGVGWLARGDVIFLLGASTIAAFLLPRLTWTSKT